MHLLICSNTTYHRSQHAKEECRAPEEGRFGRPGPPDHHWCQGSRCDDSGWIFEVRRCKRNHATTSTTPSGTYGRPEQESKGSCFRLCWRSFIAVRHDRDAVVHIVIVGIVIVIVGIVIVGIVIVGIVIVSIVILRPNDDALMTK